MPKLLLNRLDQRYVLVENVFSVCTEERRLTLPHSGNVLFISHYKVPESFLIVEVEQSLIDLLENYETSLLASQVLKEHVLKTYEDASNRKVEKKL